MPHGRNILKFDHSSDDPSITTQTNVQRVIALAPILGQVNPGAVRTVETVIRRLIDSPELERMAITPRPAKVLRSVREPRTGMNDMTYLCRLREQAAARGDQEDLEQRRRRWRTWREQHDEELRRYFEGP